jgi:hypothetical protein
MRHYGSRARGRFDVRQTQAEKAGEPRRAPLIPPGRGACIDVRRPLEAEERAE